MEKAADTVEKIKLCFFEGDMSRTGGTEKITSQLINALSELGRYDISLLTLTQAGPHFAFDVPDTVHYQYLSDHWINPGPGYLRLIPQVRKFVLEHHIDIMIDVDIVLDVLSVPALKKTSCRLISWEHFNLKYELEFPYRRFILDHFTVKADMNIVLTNQDKRFYQERFKDKVHVKCIYNFLMPEDTSGTKKDIDEISADPAAGPSDIEKKLLEIPKAEHYILSAGRLIKRKGTDFIAEIAEKCLKGHPDWMWLIAGEGEEQDNILKDLKERHIGQVVLLGRRNDVTSLMRYADIFALTARQEGLPMVLLEAMTADLPMVSFDIETGPSDIITDGVNGYLVKPFDTDEYADRLSRLMDDASLRKDLGQANEQIKVKFDRSKIVTEWDEVFKALS